MKFILEGEEKKEEQKVRLYLKEEDGEVTLCAKDDGGREWNLMLFRNGKFRRIGSLSGSIGIAVDIRGRIEEELCFKFSNIVSGLYSSA